VEIEGVFCHAAPMVLYTDTGGLMRRCELADLLIAVDTVSGGAWVRRAALIQAKMVARAARVVMSGPSTRNQLELYQQWHVFDFEEMAYELKQIDFRQGRSATHSGTFGVIDRHLIDLPRTRRSGLSTPHGPRHTTSRMASRLANSWPGWSTGVEGSVVSARPPPGPIGAKQSAPA
jgi:hypothetical protein